MGAASAWPAALASPAEIARLLAPAKGARAIVLAVSGGPDSMAMLRLAAQWRAGGGAPPLFAATVDHGLRRDARAEAESVARWAAAQGLPHQILTWTGPKPKTRLQEKARDARYALLEAHAGAIGADFLMLGHHLDDQAETVLFRLLRGTGVDGLAGMEPLSPRGGLTLFRPLLLTPKTRLVALCKALKQPFIDDPSNDDPRFARTGLRKLAPLLAEEGLDAAALARLAARALRARDAIAHFTRDMMSRLDTEKTPVGLRASLAPLRDAPDEIALRVIGGLAANAAAPGQAVRLEGLERLCAGLLPALAGRQRFRATLAGVELTLDAAARLTLAREKPRKRGAKIAPAAL